MESIKQALQRIDALLCTTAAPEPVTDPELCETGGPLDAPGYLWRGSAKPGNLAPQFLIVRPE